MIETVTALPQPVLTGLALILLVSTLLAAYKVMEIIFDTVAAAAVSGLLYGILSAFTEASFNFNTLLYFVAGGAGLYLGLNVLRTVLHATETVAKIPMKMVEALIGFLRGVKTRIDESQEEDEDDEDREEKDTKEVVLGS